MTNREKIQRLNELEVVDFSATGGELEYVMIENSEENRKVLNELGAKEDEDIFTSDNGEAIDVTVLACYLGAPCWHVDHGFMTTEEAREKGFEWAR